MVAKTKSKTTAIILAVFFSYFSWLYTYRYDAWKFWLGLGTNILLFWTIVVPIGVWIWAITDQSIKEKQKYATYYK